MPIPASPARGGSWGYILEPERDGAELGAAPHSLSVARPSQAVRDAEDDCLLVWGYVRHLCHETYLTVPAVDSTFG